jgi:hypothetical protein
MGYIDKVNAAVDSAIAEFRDEIQHNMSIKLSTLSRQFEELRQRVIALESESNAQRKRSTPSAQSIATTQSVTRGKRE